jgi:hypothetical protein
MILKNIRNTLYIAAFLLIIIPICIVIITDVGFSHTFSKITISSALILILIGKILNVLNKDKKDKSLLMDITSIFVLLITLIIMLLE